MRYLHERRARARRIPAGARRDGAGDQAATSSRSSKSSTAAPATARSRRRWCSSRCWRSCCATRTSGELVVPIVPDEARTFGMESLFRAVGIYSHVGPAVRARRHGHAAVLQGSEGRADSRGGHHRGGLDVVVHRRRHGLRDARRQHDPVLHLLLDVRLPADRRSRSGPPATRAAAASCSAAPPGGPRSPARACSTRTATATCTRWRTRTASRTIRRSPTSSR